MIRATQDVDLLVDAGDADRVDLLYARRPVARRLLQGAGEMRTSMGNFRVVSVEGLIAFKLQGFVNDARRTRDLEDTPTRRTLAAQPIAGGDVARSAPAPSPDPYRQLDDLMAVIEELCPAWPDRPTFAGRGPYRL